jgi:ABC-type amino acid transport system permease subunit
MRDGGKCIGTATHSSVPVVLKVSPISLRCSSRRPLNVARSSFYLTVALVYFLCNFLLSSLLMARMRSLCQMKEPQIG